MNQKLQTYKKRKKKSINLRLIKTKNALTKAKKNKNDKAAKYFAIKTHDKTLSNYNDGI